MTDDHKAQPDKGFLHHYFAKFELDGLQSDDAFAHWAEEHGLTGSIKRCDRVQVIDKAAVLERVKERLRSMCEDVDPHMGLGTFADGRKYEHTLSRLCIEQHALERTEDGKCRGYVMDVWGVKPHHHQQFVVSPAPGRHLLNYQPDSWRVHTVSDTNSTEDDDLFYVPVKMEDLESCLSIQKTDDTTSESVFLTMLLQGLQSEQQRLHAQAKYLNKVWPNLFGRSGGLKRLFALWLVLKAAPYFDRPEELPRNVSVAFLAA